MFVHGKVALITGGASGLGLTYAKELLKNDLKGVTLADIDSVKGKEAVEELSEKYGKNKVIFVKLDVTNKDEFEGAMIKTVETFGNFDILINNAGILDDTKWEREIDINLKGTMNGCILAFEEYLPKYKTAAEPVIINISSTAGLDPCYLVPIYSATKHAVIALSKALSLKENYESQKVRILTICPGGTATPILDDFSKKCFTPRCTEEAFKFFDEFVKDRLQNTEYVGESLVKIIECGENGSVWVISGLKTYEVKIRSLNDLEILEYL